MKLISYTGHIVMRVIAPTFPFVSCGLIAGQVSL